MQFRLPPDEISWGQFLLQILIMGLFIFGMATYHPSNHKEED